MVDALPNAKFDAAIKRARGRNSTSLLTRPLCVILKGMALASSSMSVDGPWLTLS